MTENFIRNSGLYILTLHSFQISAAKSENLRVMGHNHKLHCKCVIIIISLFLYLDILRVQGASDEEVHHSSVCGGHSSGHRGSEH